MKKTTILLVTLLTSLLMVSAIQANPLMGLQQLLGFGNTDVTTQQVDSRGYGYPGYGFGYGPGYGPGDKPQTFESTAVNESDGRPTVVDPGQGVRNRYGR